MENEKTQEQKNTRPEVFIFGEELRREKRKEDRRERRERLGRRERHYHGGGIFGLLILFSGAILLLNNFGLVSPQFWQIVMPFWPVLLVLLGIRIILGHNWFSFMITFVLTLIILGSIFIYGLMRVNSPTVNYLPERVPNFINNLSV